MTCFLLESFESAKVMSMGPTSKSSSRVGKTTSNGAMKLGNRTVSSVCYDVFTPIASLKFNGDINYMSRGL